MTDVQRKRLLIVAGVALVMLTIIVAVVDVIRDRAAAGRQAAFKARYEACEDKYRSMPFPGPAGAAEKQLAVIRCAK